MSEQPEQPDQFDSLHLPVDYTNVVHDDDASVRVAADQTGGEADGEHE